MLKRRKALLEKVINRHSERDFRQMLLQAGKIDRTIKGLDKSNAWDELLSLTLHLAGIQPVMLP